MSGEGENTVSEIRKLSPVFVRGGIEFYSMPLICERCSAVYNKGSSISGRPIIERSDAIIRMLDKGMKWPEISRIYDVKDVAERLSLQKQVRDRRAYLARQQRAKHEGRPSSSVESSVPGGVQ
jgi:hypothetical protein